MEIQTMNVTVKNALATFSNVYPGFPNVTDVTVGIWARYLNKYSEDIIREAADRYVMESRLTPTPSDILNICYKLQTDKEMSEKAKKEQETEDGVDYENLPTEAWFGK